MDSLAQLSALSGTQNAYFCTSGNTSQRNIVCQRPVFCESPDSLTSSHGYSRRGTEAHSHSGRRTGSHGMRVPLPAPSWQTIVAIFAWCAAIQATPEVTSTKAAAWVVISALLVIVAMVGSARYPEEL